MIKNSPPLRPFISTTPLTLSITPIYIYNAIVLLDLRLSFRKHQSSVVDMLLSGTDFIGAIATVSDEKQTHVLYGVFCCLLSNNYPLKNLTMKIK